MILLSPESLRSRGCDIALRNEFVRGFDVLNFRSARFDSAPRRSQFANNLAESSKLHCTPPTQCRSNRVSGRSLPKAGVLQCPPETIGNFAQSDASFAVFS